MKTYTGGCHCGAVRYEVDADFTKAIECNCSYCYKKGLILSFVPGEQLRVTAGTEADMTEYRFNRKTIQHLFCSTCGVQCFARANGKEGKPGAMVNLRTLNDVPLSDIDIQPFNGKDF